MARKLPVAALLTLCFTSALLAQEVGSVPPAVPPYYALTGATVAVGDGNVLSNATVVINDGLIEAVGTGLAAPPGAWKIDATGMFVYPGLIDALTHEGLKRPSGASQPAQPGRRGNQSQQEENEEGPGYFAHVSAADLLDPDDNKAASWRESGVLTLNVAPNEGIFRGRAALVNLNGKEPDEMIVRAGTLMNMAFQSLGFRTFPGSLMGVIAHIRQTLSDAGHYGLVWAEYEKDKKGMKRPETDRTMQALQPVLHGALPLAFPAKTQREIERALKLCADSKTRCILAGGFEAPAVADQLKEADAAVLVSLDYPKKPRDPHPEFDEAFSTLRYRAQAPEAAARLHEAGVRFAFFSDGANSRDFLANLRKAVEKGLPKEAALRAATLSAAEILGVADQLGTLEKGKIANLVVADKDLFDEKAAIRHIFVDGVHFDIPAKKEEKKGDADAPLAQAAGTWDVTVTPPGQTVTMTFTLVQDGQSLEGTVTNDEGTLQIYDGSVSGDTVSFKFEVDMGGGPTEITISGTVSGDSMSGTASVADLGAAPMEATRIP